MRLKFLVFVLSVVVGSSTVHARSAEVLADYRAVPSLRHHLPLNIPEVINLDEHERTDLECLYWNLYFEARGGVRSEQIAVAHVPINRTRSPHFSTDICTNVFQYGWAGGRRQYQFSWAGIVRGPRWRREDETWVRMQQIALQVYRGELRDPSNGATFFHHASIASNWSGRNKIRLGTHVFWTR